MTEKKQQSNKIQLHDVIRQISSSDKSEIGYRNLNKYIKQVKLIIKEDERRKTIEEVLKTIMNWWEDDKTCSGKPHCLIDDCDLCYNCLNDLLEQVKKMRDGK